MSISIAAAFLGGVLSLLSPCSALVLPTFFAATFKNKGKLILATLVFSAGLITILLPVGFGAFGLGRLLLFHRQPVSLAIGFLLAVAAVFVILGRRIPFPNVANRLLLNNRNRGYSSAFSLGLVSGVGSSACVGPILGAIVTLAAAAVNPPGAFILMLAYASGIALPLFVVSLVYDRYGLNKLRILRGKMITLGKMRIHSNNLLTGLLLFIIAYIFLRYQGSLGSAPIFTKTGILDFYFDLQDKLFTL